MAEALRKDADAWKHVTDVLRFTPDVAVHLGLYADHCGRRWLAYPYRQAGAWTYANCRSLDGEKDFLRIPSGQKTQLYRVDVLEDGGTAILVEGERDAAAALTMNLHAELGGAGGAAVVGMPGVEQVEVAVRALETQRLVYLCTDNDQPGEVAAEKLAARLGPERCRRVRLDEFKDLGDLLSAIGAEKGSILSLEAFRRADQAGPFGAMRDRPKGGDHRDQHRGNRAGNDAEAHHRDDQQVGDDPKTDSPWPVLPQDALYGPAGDFVAAVEPHTEADLAALLVQFLVAFGNAIGRSPYFHVEGVRHHTNLNAVMVGRTSKGRKGTSWGRVRQFYAQVDSAWVKGREVSGLSSGEGLIWAVRDPVYKADEDGDEKMVDPGVDDKRLMVLEAEFASSLRVSRRETNILSAVIRTAWDTGTLRTLTKNSPAVATDAHISIIGHITKDELLRHLDVTEMANGFANRFLWVCVQRSKSLPEGGNLEESTLSSFYSCIRNTLEAARRIGQIVRSEAARALWGRSTSGLPRENRACSAP